MRDRRLPVDHGVSCVARGALVALVFTPTAVLLVAGVVLKIMGGSHSDAGGGALMWLLLMVGTQAIVLVACLGHWPWAAKMMPNNPPEPPKLEPGIFKPWA